MTRPASHRKQEIQPRCSNCCYSAYPEMSRRLFCVKDDAVGKNGRGEIVTLNGQDMKPATVSEFRALLNAHLVLDGDVCDEHKKRQA